MIFGLFEEEEGALSLSMRDVGTKVLQLRFINVLVGFLIVVDSHTSAEWCVVIPHCHQQSKRHNWCLAQNDVMLCYPPH